MPLTLVYGVLKEWGFSRAKRPKINFVILNRARAELAREREVKDLLFVLENCKVQIAIYKSFRPFPFLSVWRKIDRTPQG